MRNSFALFGCLAVLASPVFSTATAAQDAQANGGYGYGSPYAATTDINVTDCIVVTNNQRENATHDYDVINPTEMIDTRDDRGAIPGSSNPIDVVSVGAPDGARTYWHNAKGEPCTPVYKPSTPFAK